ncbi:MAG: hypothetical protein IPG99_13055 [Ignavibacteria bacterium]|nr:hypothetical protein [Ignavibacteria bacterium]
MTISPVQYNPLTGELKAYSLIGFELVYEGSSNENNVKLTSARELPRSLKIFYKDLIVNYQVSVSFHFSS